MSILGHLPYILRPCFFPFFFILSFFRSAFFFFFFFLLHPFNLSFSFIFRAFRLSNAPGSHLTSTAATGTSHSATSRLSGPTTAALRLQTQTALEVKIQDGAHWPIGSRWPIFQEPCVLQTQVGVDPNRLDVTPSSAHQPSTMFPTSLKATGDVDILSPVLLACAIIGLKQQPPHVKRYKAASDLDRSLNVLL